MRPGPLASAGPADCKGCKALWVACAAYTILLHRIMPIAVTRAVRDLHSHRLARDLDVLVAPVELVSLTWPVHQRDEHLCPRTALLLDRATFPRCQRGCSIHWVLHLLHPVIYGIVGTIAGFDFPVQEQDSVICFHEGKVFV